MVVHRFVAIATVAALFLAGCASSPSAGPDGASQATSSSAAPTSKAAPAAEKPAPRQIENIAWSGGGNDCYSDAPPGDAAMNLYAPQFASVLYAVATVDHATRGAAFTATFTPTVGASGETVLFWNGTAGPGGRITSAAGMGSGLQETPTLKGTVPNDADFFTATSCGAGGESVHYTVGV